VSGWAGGSFTTAGNPENPPPLSSVGVAVDWNSSAYKDSNLFWKAGYAPQEFYSDPTSSKLGVAKGNCTWYVNGRLRQLGYDVNSLNKMTGMAKTWRDSAKKAGLVVDKKPTVGSILQTTAGSGGHVAVVEKINADGSLTISESSYVDTNAYPQLAKWDFKYRTRIIPKNKIPGYNYIHVPKGANSGLVFQNNTTTFAYPTLSEFPSLPKPNCEAAHWYSAPGVAEIPCLMTKKGWNYAAGLMSYWFAGAGSNFYISIDDVKKRNSQVQTFINELQDEKVLQKIS
jgi:surface antigen